MNKYIWEIEIILKSGKEIKGFYKGEEIDSFKVANKLFSGGINAINGIDGEDGIKNLYFKIGEVAAFTISRAFNKKRQSEDYKAQDKLTTGNHNVQHNNQLDDNGTYRYWTEVNCGQGFDCNKREFKEVCSQDCNYCDYKEGCV